MRSSPSKVMVALQTKDGLAFGYVEGLTDKGFTFEVNSNIAPGEELTFRMELKGYEETIMGLLRVTSGRKGTVANWPVYQATILEIPKEDRALLEVWMEDQSKGGSSRRVERNPDDYVRDMFSQKMSGATTAATNLVIERMNERRARRDRLFKKSDDLFKKQMQLSPGSALGTSKSEDAPIDRAALREAFTTPAEPEPADDEQDGLDLFDLDDLD